MASKFFRLIKRPLFKKSAIIFGGCLFVIALIIFIFNFSYRNKILPQTYIGGVNVGGMTQTQAENVLSSEAAASQKNEIDLHFNDQNWQIKSQDLNYKLKLTDSAKLAWQIGRNGTFGAIIKEQVKSVFGGNARPAVFDLDLGKLNQNINNISTALDIAEKDATVTIENNQGVVQAEQNGRKLDFELTQALILQTLGNFKNSADITLPVNQINPKVTMAGAQAAANSATQILSQAITLKSPTKSYTLNPKDFASWLIFSAEVPQQTSTGKVDLTKTGSEQTPAAQWHLEVLIDGAHVADYLNSISPEINQEPKDAKFAVQNGQVTTFQTSQTGYKLDADKAKTLISTSILGQIATVELPVQIIQPKVASDSATAMGITELVAQGQTSWRGSPANRIHNLSLGAQNISGTIVQPGQEFSTIQAIGPIDGAHGFLQELVIKNSTQVVPEFGGGLCQVSTTLFRAVLNAGLKITDRTPHSFRVSYYEPPVGMDATIYDPAPDFKFINTMKTPILIWGIATNNGLNFQIYGTKDGRQVSISTPAIGSYIDPPGPVYTESDTMEPGTIRQVEKALRGATASFHYSVTDAAGKSMENQTFVSKYVALPDSFLVGPGWTPPPPE